MRYLHGDLLNTAPPAFAKHGSPAVAPTKPSTPYTELYYALEVRGQFWLADRVSVVTAIPLVNNYQAVDHITHADILAMGDPSTELIRAANDLDVDLIAMSTHGHRFLNDLIRGTTADRVRHLVKVPVLLLRAQ